MARFITLEQSNIFSHSLLKRIKERVDEHLARIEMVGRKTKLFNYPHKVPLKPLFRFFALMIRHVICATLVGEGLYYSYKSYANWFS